ncbi:MAG: hypothetical protein KIT84_32445 [Labilithrix sp.]|nr:hypothetical protein [Labilithrix sp.]MCW5815784.1 hypothetical protein [Labilithrix sp.]
MKSLRPLFGNTSDVEARLREGLARLAAEGLCAAGEMRLTATGERKAAALLGVKAGAKPTWARLKASLVELALGRSPSERPLGAGAIRAVALASKLGLETKSTRQADVLDAWAARELGMAGQRLTIANVRAFALSRALGIESLRDPKRIGAVATAHVLGVPRTDAGLVRDAVLRDWLEKPAAAAPEGDELHSFASAVKEIARATEDDGRFGRHKVFIAPIWRRARASFRSMDEGQFKAKLVDAHRAGLLRLARADLTPAMAPDVVEASEVPYLNAVFHFVDLEGALS